MELNPNTTYDGFSNVDSAAATALLFERRVAAASYALQALFLVLIYISWVKDDKNSWHEEQMLLGPPDITKPIQTSGSQQTKARKSTAHSNSIANTASSYSAGSHASAITITSAKHKYDDHHNDGNEERPPKRLRMSADEGSTSKDKHLLACHFHKQATTRIPDASTSSNVYLRTCAGPGWKDIEKLRNHLESVHTSFRPHLASRCTSCDTLFPDQVQLEQHRAQTERCSSMLDLSNDSISKSQWTQIDCLLNEGVGKGGNETRKWFQIWNVIFPNIEAPSNPWQDSNQIACLHRTEICDEDYGSPHSDDVVASLGSNSDFLTSSTPPSLASESSLVSSEVATEFTFTGHQGCQEEFSALDRCWQDYGGAEYSSRLYLTQWSESLFVDWPDRLMEKVFQDVDVDGVNETSELGKSPESSVILKDNDTQDPWLEVDVHSEHVDCGSAITHDAAQDDFASMQASLENHLAHDPEFAAISKSLAEAKWRREHSPVSPGIISCTASDDTNPERDTQPSTSSASQQANSGSFMSTKQQPRKHLTTNDSDDDEDQDIPQPKRQKGPEEPAELVKPPKFACHFHKRKPEVYCLHKSRCLTTQEQIKWRTCAGQGSKELRHLIKDDLNHHRIYDCDVCYQEFDTSDQHFAHKEDGRCIRHPGGGRERPQREGITQSQWIKIEKIAKNRDHQEKKWRDIWGILFPNDPQPRSPWASDEDDELGLPRFSVDVDKVADMYRLLVQGAISTEKLPSCTQETYEVHVQLMHDALRIVHDCKNQSSRTIPTPSSCSKVAETPFVSESPWPGAQSSPPQERISRSYKNMLTPAQSSPGSTQHRPSHFPHETANFAFSPNPSSTSERRVDTRHNYSIIDQGKGSDQKTKSRKPNAQTSVPVNRSARTQQELAAINSLRSSHSLQPVPADATSSSIPSSASKNEELLPQPTDANVNTGEDPLRHLEPNMNALVEARVDAILAKRFAQNQSAQRTSTFPQVASGASRAVSRQNMQNTHLTQSAEMDDPSPDLIAWHPLPLNSRYSKQPILAPNYSNFEGFPDPNLYVGAAGQSPFAICQKDFADSPARSSTWPVNPENQINPTRLESLGSGRQSITPTMDSSPFAESAQHHYPLKLNPADVEWPTTMITPPSQLLNEGNHDLDNILGIEDNGMGNKLDWGNPDLLFPRTGEQMFRQEDVNHSQTPIDWGRNNTY